MIEVLFLVSVVLIWIAVLHGVVMVIAATLLVRGEAARTCEPTVRGDWQGVSVLVPARDEAEVIEESLRRYLALDYPRDLLEVVLVDDGSSDATGEIADRVAAEDDRVTVVHVPRAESGRGKSAALNRGLASCRHGLIAIYDADNRPRPDALRRLVAALDDGRHVASVGRIVKVNSRATLLSRLSWLDFLTFQWTFQAGRSKLFDVTLLPGTNYVVRADAVRRLGGWDPRALTEDLELSVRLYCGGERVAFVPEAVSEEQDPARLRDWVNQRARWLRGNYYVLFRRTGAMVRSRRPRVLVLVWEMFELYSTFVIAICVSQAILVTGLLGVYRVHIGGPLVALWGLAFLAYVAVLQTAATLERQDSLLTPLLACVMYVVYGPLWLVILCRAVVLSIAQRGGVQWAKTPHIRY